MPIQALSQEEIDEMLMNEHDYPYQVEDSDFDDGSFEDNPDINEDEFNYEGT